MISQMPLVIACTCLAWSAGLFASLCATSMTRRGGMRGQLLAGVASLVLLVAGGVCMVARTQHWERLFNVFGNIAAPMTQQAIAIAVLLIAIVAFMVALWRLEDRPPVALLVVGIVASLALVITIGRAIMMPTKPLLEIVISILIVLGGACVLGPVTMAAIDAFAANGPAGDEDAADTDEETPAASGASSILWPFALAGGTLNAIMTVAGLAFMQVSISAAEAAKSSAVHYGFDPTSPTTSLTKAAAATPFSGDCLLLSITAIVFAFATLALVALGKRTGAWRLFGTFAALLAAVCLGCVLAVGFQTGMFFSISF